MEPDEVRAEIERRKQRAEDLGLRELLWSLHGRLNGYAISKDREMICSEISESLKTSGNIHEFAWGQSLYQLAYTEGPHRTSEFLGRGEIFEGKSVHAMLALSVAREPVFKFEIRRSTRYLDDGPVWRDDVGTITRFIEGRWVEELPNLMKAIRDHEKSVRDLRNAPRLEAERKRFGL
jgi:hypothetical protein